MACAFAFSVHVTLRQYTARHLPERPLPDSAIFLQVCQQNNTGAKMRFTSVQPAEAFVFNDRERGFDSPIVLEVDRVHAYPDF